MSKPSEPSLDDLIEKNLRTALANGDASAAMVTAAIKFRLAQRGERDEDPFPTPPDDLPEEVRAALDGPPEFGD